MRISRLSMAERFASCAVGLTLMLGIAPSTLAQDADAVAKQKLTDAAREGFPLTTMARGFGARENVATQPASGTQGGSGEAAGSGKSGKSKDSKNPASTVADSVTAEAVLLPEKVCRRVLGKEISQNYAVIELTLSNHSRDASVIVQSLYIDYSNWLLNSDSLKGAAGANDHQAWEGATRGNQISSVEYRVARGQVLDRQPWTRRNAVVHALELAGTIASAYAFVTTDLDITRGISAFAGQVVPGVDKFWPDGTVGQMNRISDFGFRVNKVIPKESSDIVVAFFPIDRFLTPGLKKLFLKSPATFFSPSAMILDPEGRKDLSRIIDPLLAAGATAGGTPLTLDKLAADEMQGNRLSPQELMLREILNRSSLNNVKVLVGGIMTVDVTSVAAQLDSVSCASADSSKSDPWAQSGDVDCVVSGVYLTDGTPKVEGAGVLGISDPTVDTDNSNDNELHFKITLSKELPPGTNLTFTVTKTDKAKKVITSPQFMVPVNMRPKPSDGSSGGGAAAAPANQPATGAPPAATPTPATAQPKKNG